MYGKIIPRKYYSNSRATRDSENCIITDTNSSSSDHTDRDERNLI